MWLPTLDALDRLQKLERIPITSKSSVPVQVYPVEGSDLQSCDVYKVDINKDQAALQRGL